MERVAIILTSYNRAEKTYNCIEKILASNLSPNYYLETFLLDDFSTDNTVKRIKDSFPNVNIILGNGNLFWCGGMRMAWDAAYKKHDFEYYIWINDDIEIFEDSICQLLDVQNEYFTSNLKNCIVFGFCSSMHGNEITYVGIRNKNFLIPNGKPQKADMINGNIVLVPRLVFKILGNLSEKYTHGMADYDYSLRAKENGIHCISTKNVVAKCDRNIDIFTHNKFSVKYKFNHLYKILTNKYIKFRFDEYCYFRKRFFSDSTFYIYVKFIVYNISKIIMSTSLK